MVVSSFLSGLLNVGVILLISPFFMTLIKKVKARTQRRSGPPLLQGYWNLAKLFKKEVIYSDYASFISRIAPYASLSILLVAALMVPIIWIPDVAPITGNIIIFLYLLAFTRFLMALLGLDAGSTFGGMGSSREMSLSAVIEPTDGGRLCSDGICHGYALHPRDVQTCNHHHSGNEPDNYTPLGIPLHPDHRRDRANPGG